MTALRKPVLRILEKMFEIEIELARTNALHSVKLPPIYQSKAAILQTMEDDGLIKWHEETLPGHTFRVTVRGWLLTHKGRQAYCEACDGR